METKNNYNQIKELKLVAFDLDGTLLNSHSDLSDKTLEAILNIHQRGLKIVIASGRIYPMLESYIKRIGVVDYVISANGASIDDFKNGTRVEHIYVDELDARKVVHFCKENQIECLILKRNMSYFPNDSQRIEKFNVYNNLSKTHGHKPMDLAFYEESFNDYTEIEKILINEKNQLNMQKIADFIESNTILKYTKSGKNLLDISQINVSKEEALVKVCKIYDIDLSEVMVFGDYDNDIGMMEVAGYGVAPQNASIKALEAADFITLTNDEDGIAYMLNKLIELGKI